MRISWYIGSGKIVRTGAPGGSRTLDFLRARQAPYPLGQALRLYLSYRADTISIVKISKGHNSVKNVDGFWTVFSYRADMIFIGKIFKGV